MCSLSASGGKKNNFGQILTLGLLYRPPFTDEGQSWCATEDPHAKFRLDRYILSPSVGEKPQILPILLTSAFCGVASGYLRKLNTSAQLQTFPYPTVSKSFVYSNVVMAKSGAQTFTFKSVTDRQTNTKKTLNV